MTWGYQVIILALIRNRELALLGVRGITHIPASEIDVVDKDEFANCVNALIGDGVLGPLKGKSGGYVRNQKIDNIQMVTVNCLMTANEIREQYKSHLALVHGPQFSPDMSKLSFGGHDIQISKSKGDAHKLLCALFSDNIHRQWEYDEIWGEGLFGAGKGFFVADEGKNGSAIYQAYLSVNEKIQKKTMIGDFLKRSDSSIRINPIYIP